MNPHANWDLADPGRSDCVTYNFYGAVDARGGSFGSSCGRHCEAGARLGQATGKLREVDVHATVSNYVRPPTFEAAAAWLRRNHLVVLAGPPGSGRRAGALALLREVTDGRIVALPPTVAAHDLAEWEFQAEHGYLVVDNQALDRGGSELVWALVAERVRYAGTYLVVTTASARGTSLTEVPYLAWQRPPVAEVLRTHLAGNWPKDDVDDLVEFLVPKLPADRTLRWVAGLARLVNTRRDPARALVDMEETCGRRVNRWFDRPRSLHELAQITVAAFLAVPSEHTYRVQLARLEQLIVRRQPGSGARRRGGMPEPGSGGFLPSAPFAAQPADTCVVCCRQNCYQRFALARIWEISEHWFRAAVQEWIDAAVLEHERLDVAAALALLAASNFDDVERSFLDRWSRGTLGSQGLVSATYVLWWMCREEDTAHLALRTAIRWAGAGDANQRTTALMAFSGELGISYPAEAARRLWQLITQTEDVRTAGCAALGRLFATLVDQTGEADAVLTLLDSQHTRCDEAECTRRSRRATTEAVLGVLAVQSHRTTRPAVVEFLRGEPGRVDVVARLWGRVIRSRSAGRDGVNALWSALTALRHRDDQGLVVELGQAFAGALTGAERSRLRADLASRAARSRSAHLAQTLAEFLAAVAAPPAPVAEACPGRPR